MLNNILVWPASAVWTLQNKNNSQQTSFISAMTIRPCYPVTTDDDIIYLQHGLTIKSI